MADPTTDVIDLIKADHRTVERLLDKLESDSTSDDEKERLIRQLADELLPHSKGEEDVAYPAIRAAAPEETEEVKDGVAEHHHIEDMVEQLLGEPLDAPGADGILAAVVAELRHHVEEEEEDVLPDYAKRSSAEERAEVGRRFTARKDEDRAARGLPPSGAADDLIDLTKDELYERAKRAEIPGRSDMTKEQLRDALKG